MNKINYLYLPVAGLALLLGTLVFIASMGYRVQYLNSEWVEYVEHWVDKRQEALQNLQEYAEHPDADEFYRYQKANREVERHSKVGLKMIEPSYPAAKVRHSLQATIGFDREVAKGLIWMARTLRPLLNIEQDHRLWKKIATHWQKLGPIADSLQNLARQKKLPTEKWSELRNRLHRFAKKSYRYDRRIQDRVQSASEDLKFWSNTITQGLALLLFLGGATIITLIFYNARKNQMRFRTLFDSAPDGIVLADAGGHLIEINDSFRRIFGYRGDEVRGSNIDQFLTRTEEEMHKAFEITDRLRNNETIQQEVVRYDKDGNRIDALLSAVPVTVKDRVISYFAIYTDISERKELERKNRELLQEERRMRARAVESRRRLEQMFEEAPSAIALVEGPEFKYVFQNKMHRELTGVDAVEKTVNEMFPEFKTQGLIDLLQHVYETGETYEGTEEPIKLEQGEATVTYYRDYLYKPLKDEAGDPYAVFIDSVDVTDKVRYRQQLQEELKEKTTLLEEIHHRVKNNLASITGLLHLQRETLEDGKARQALMDSQLRIHTMADIHNMLYESDRLNEIRMDKYIEKLMAEIQKVVNPSGSIKVVTDVEQFSLDINQAQPLALMLNEIIQNSFKHAFPDQQEGEVCITGSVDESKITIEVQDNGIGFSDGEEGKKGTSGLGLQLIETIQQQLEAKVERTNKNGTRYQIAFKKAQ